MNARMNPNDAYRQPATKKHKVIASDSYSKIEQSMDEAAKEGYHFLSMSCFAHYHMVVIMEKDG